MEAELFAEKEALDEKLSKLRKSIDSLDSSTPPRQLSLLIRQEKAMAAYSDILGQRIEMLS